MAKQVNCADFRKVIISYFKHRLSDDVALASALCSQHRTSSFDNIELNYINLLKEQVENKIISTFHGYFILDNLRAVTSLFEAAKRTFNCNFLFRFSGETVIDYSDNSLCTANVTFEEQCDVISIKIMDSELITPTPSLGSPNLDMTNCLEVEDAFGFLNYEQSPYVVENTLNVQEPHCSLAQDGVQTGASNVQSESGDEWDSEGERSSIALVNKEAEDAEKLARESSIRAKELTQKFENFRLKSEKKKKKREEAEAERIQIAQVLKKKEDDERLLTEEKERKEKKAEVIKEELLGLVTVKEECAGEPGCSSPKPKQKKNKKKTTKKKEETYSDVDYEKMVKVRMPRQVLALIGAILTKEHDNNIACNRVVFDVDDDDTDVEYPGDEKITSASEEEWVETGEILKGKKRKKTSTKKRREIAECYEITGSRDEFLSLLEDTTGTAFANMVRNIEQNCKRAANITAAAVAWQLKAAERMHGIPTNFEDSELTFTCHNCALHCPNQWKSSTGTAPRGRPNKYVQWLRNLGRSTDAKPKKPTKNRKKAPQPVDALESNCEQGI